MPLRYSYNTDTIQSLVVELLQYFGNMHKKLKCFVTTTEINYNRATFNARISRYSDCNRNLQNVNQ